MTYHNDIGLGFTRRNLDGSIMAVGAFLESEPQSEFHPPSERAHDESMDAPSYGLIEIIEDPTQFALFMTQVINPCLDSEFTKPDIASSSNIRDVIAEQNPIKAATRPLEIALACFSQPHHVTDPDRHIISEMLNGIVALCERFVSFLQENQTRLEAFKSNRKRELGVAAFVFMTLALLSGDKRLWLLYPVPAPIRAFIPIFGMLIVFMAFMILIYFDKTRFDNQSQSRQQDFEFSTLKDAQSIGRGFERHMYLCRQETETLFAYFGQARTGRTPQASSIDAGERIGNTIETLNFMRRRTQVHTEVNRFCRYMSTMGLEVLSVESGFRQNRDIILGEAVDRFVKRLGATTFPLAIYSLAIAGFRAYGLIADSLGLMTAAIGFGILSLMTGLSLKFIERRHKLSNTPVNDAFITQIMAHISTPEAYRAADANISKRIAAFCRFDHLRQFKDDPRHPKINHP